MAMDKRITKTIEESKEIPAPADGTPRVVKYAGKIHTSRDFANFMSALMSDLVEGKISPNVGNATCNAGGKLLKTVEMEYKYGTKDDKGNQHKTLMLAIEEPEEEE